MEYRTGADRPYSGLILAARITLAHFSVSSAMNLPKSIFQVHGVDADGVVVMRYACSFWTRQFMTEPV